jgi:hypothetical protein
MRSLAVSVVAMLAAGCGGLESPDLSTGAIEGRISPAFEGGRVYVLGSPDRRADLGTDGTFRLEGVPIGPVTLVAYDGGERAGLLPVLVRGAEVTSVLPGAAQVDGPQAGSPPPAADPADFLPLAGRLVVRALAGGGGEILGDARFTVEGTEWVDVAPDASGAGTPLPPGLFQLVVRAAGYVDASLAVEVRSDEVVRYDVPLARAP